MRYIQTEYRQSREILPFLKKADIQAFSLTDHDTVDGITEARKLSTSDNSNDVSGIEFPCRPQEMYPGGEQFSIHLLGYQLDEEISGSCDNGWTNERDMVKTVDLTQLCTPGHYRRSAARFKEQRFPLVEASMFFS